MRALDPAIALLREPVDAGVRPAYSPAANEAGSKPSIRNPATGSIGAWILSTLLALFKRKGK